MAKNSSQWQVESVRCTVFPDRSESFDPTNWWVDVLDEQPDQVTTQPIEGKFKAQGAERGGALELSVQPLRIQWTLQPNPPDMQGETWEIPNVGGIERVSEFVAIVTRWLPIAPILSRLAFGAVLLDVVDDRKTGYDRLDRMLPNVDVDSSAMRDFLYQVNRRRASKVISGIQVNRLTKWSVATISPMSIQIDGSQQTIQRKLAEPIEALRLEVDINNVPSPDYIFSSDDAVRLFEELTAMGLEISEIGDAA